MTEHVAVEMLPYAKDLKTRLPYTESALRVEIAQAIGAASTCWENLNGAGVFESDRASKICDDLVEKVLELTGLGEASLGCATNQELIDEINTRRELGHSDPDYRTVEA